MQRAVAFARTGHTENGASPIPRPPSLLQHVEVHEQRLEAKDAQGCGELETVLSSTPGVGCCQSVVVEDEVLVELVELGLQKFPPHPCRLEGLEVDLLEGLEVEINQLEELFHHVDQLEELVHHAPPLKTKTKL